MKVALFYFVFEGNFQVQPPGGLYLEGDLTEGFLRFVFGGLCLEGLIHGGAYFQNFMVSLSSIFSIPDRKDTPFTCCFKI